MDKEEKKVSDSSRYQGPSITQLTEKEKEKLEFCSCCSGEKALYVCTDTDCPLNSEQLLYCETCNEKDIHKHRSVGVNRKVFQEGEAWMKTKSRAD